MNPADTKILIVEDEGIVAIGIKATLLGFGYKVLPIAISGESAIRIASEHKPDLVLMDIKLRGRLNGIETATVLIRQYSTPVIYCTAHSDPATMEAAQGTSPSAILMKPVSDSDLKAAVQHALGFEEQ